MKARKDGLVVPLMLVLVFPCAGRAQAPAPEPTATQLTIGVKLWRASWLSYIPAAYTGVGADGAFAVGDSVNAVEGSVQTDVLPSFSVRHGNFFASASHGRFSSDFRVLSSPVVMPSGQTLITTRTDHFKRRESDLNVGYSLTPEFGLALNYKDATETRDTSLGIAPQRAPLLKTDVKGLLVGATGSFAVLDKLRLYTQAGYGPARLRLAFADNALGTAKAKGRYFIGELGLSYPLFGSVAGLSGATAAIGYRTQTVKTDSYGSGFQESRDLRDVRDGLVLTLNVGL